MIDVDVDAIHARLAQPFRGLLDDGLLGRLEYEWDAEASNIADLVEVSGLCSSPSTALESLLDVVG